MKARVVVRVEVDPSEAAARGQVWQEEATLEAQPYMIPAAVQSTGDGLLSIVGRKMRERRDAES